MEKKTVPVPSRFLHCCIVEDHCDIVPFLHACFRKKICCPTKKLLFVHFDAHPDMSVPTTTKLIDWTNLASLHDALEDDVCGISQFIVPLVANEIISKVVWIRSPWSDQLDDGNYRYHVGDVLSTSSVDCARHDTAVSLAADYYVDDDSYRPESELNMVTAKMIDLTVACLGQPPQVHVIDNVENEDDVCWVLDICLDYFTTLNPFLPELECALRQDLLATTTSSATLTTLDPEQALTVVQNLFRFMPFRRCPSVDCNIRQMRTDVLDLLKQLLLPTVKDDGDVDKDKDRDREKDSHNDSKRQRCRNEHMAFEDVSQALSTLYGQCDQKAVRPFLLLLPHLSSVTRKLIHEIGSAVLLPHHISDDEEIDHLVAQMKTFLETACSRVAKTTSCNSISRPLGRPVVVTIARSALDGFIPSHVVNRIQEKVLVVLRELLSGCWDSNGLAPVVENHAHVASNGIISTQAQLVVHDLTEDAAARAYTMFLNPLARSYCTEQVS